jgi:hypothetical protein
VVCLAWLACVILPWALGGVGLREALRRLGLADLLLLGALPLYLLYVGNGIHLASGDTVPTRYLPSLILKEGTLDLSRVDGFREKYGSHYSVLPIGDALLSNFPLGTAFLAVPHAAIALAGSQGRVDESLVARWEKHFSALLATTCAVLCFLTIRQRLGGAVASGSTVVFALATPVATHCAQGLWSLSGEVFCISLGLFLLWNRPGRLSASLAGAVMGFAYLCRPTALIPLSAMAAALFVIDRRRAAWFAVASAGALAISVACLEVWYGNPLGSYGFHARLFEVPPSSRVENLLGTLLSPSRGALIFLPYLLVLPAVRTALRELGPLRIWWWAGLLVVLATWGVAGSYVKWWGGWSLGPRLMTEAAPFLALLTLPLWLGWPRIGAATRVALVAAVGFASATQLLAAYRVEGQHWNAAVDVDAHPEVLWSLRNSQLAAIWRPGWSFRLEPDAIRALEKDGAVNERWRRVDLTRVANARYDLDPFQPSTPRAWPRFGRIDPPALNQPGARFHFAPRGAPNSVTARAGLSPQIAVGSLRALSIRAILSAEWSGDPEATLLVGRLHVGHADGARETIPLRLNVDVFPYQGDPFRAHPVPAERAYFGSPNERTVLVESVYPVQRDAGIDWIQLETVGTEPPNAVTLLALTLETEGVSTAGDALPGASS